MNMIVSTVLGIRLPSCSIRIFCFVTDGIEGLDYTLIGIGERRSGSRALDEFGFIPLSDADDKHMLGELANLIRTLRAGSRNWSCAKTNRLRAMRRCKSCTTSPIPSRARQARPYSILNPSVNLADGSKVQAQPEQTASSSN